MRTKAIIHLLKKELHNRKHWDCIIFLADSLDWFLWCRLTYGTSIHLADPGVVVTQDMPDLTGVVTRNHGTLSSALIPCTLWYHGGRTTNSWNKPNLLIYSLLQQFTNYYNKSAWLVLYICKSALLVHQYNWLGQETYRYYNHLSVSTIKNLRSHVTEISAKMHCAQQQISLVDVAVVVCTPHEYCIVVPRLMSVSKKLENSPREGRGKLFLQKLYN